MPPPAAPRASARSAARPRQHRVAHHAAARPRRAAAGMPRPLPAPPSAAPPTADRAAAPTRPAAADAGSPDGLPLPPGSRGVPWLGESLSLFADMPAFHATRRAAHGDIYKTRLFGVDTVVVFDEGECRRLLLADGTLTETAWPGATRALLGERSILMQTGAKHAGQRRVLGQAFTGKAVESYGAVVEAAVRRSLAAWAEAEHISGIGTGKDLAFEVAIRALVDPACSEQDMADFRADFDTFQLGLMSLPINLPGFKFRAAMKARGRVLDRIETLIRAAAGAPPTPPGVARNALQLMLQARDEETGEGATMEELKDQVREGEGSRGPRARAASHPLNPRPPLPDPHPTLCRPRDDGHDRGPPAQSAGRAAGRAGGAARGASVGRRGARPRPHPARPGRHAVRRRRRAGGRPRVARGERGLPESARGFGGERRARARGVGALGDD